MTVVLTDTKTGGAYELDTDPRGTGDDVHCQHCRGLL